VFADVDRRQLPDRGEVQRFVERALVDSAVAEERDRDLVRPELLRGERGTGGDGDPAADDPIRAEVALRRVGDMHRAAPAAAVPRFPPEKPGDILAKFRPFPDAGSLTTFGEVVQVSVGRGADAAGADGSLPAVVGVG